MGGAQPHTWMGREGCLEEATTEVTTDQWKKLVGKGVRRPKRHCLEIQNYRSGEREREREREEEWSRWGTQPVVGRVVCGRRFRQEPPAGVMLTASPIVLGHM